MKISELNITLVDNLVGNDYSTCLALGLSTSMSKISLVVPENRKISFVDEKIKVYYWSPTKDQTKSKFVKFVNYYKYLIRLFNLIHKNKKIVHYQFFRRKEDVLFLIILKLTGIRIVYTAHNILPHNRTKFDFLIYKLVYQIVNEIIVHSEYIKNKLVSTFNVSSQKVNVIPHGNFDIYLPKENISKNDARKILNLKEDDDVILFFGYIKEYKGLDTLIQSFPKAAQKNSKLKLLIAGMPENLKLNERYIKLIESLNCKESVLYEFSFIPSNSIALYFSASDLVVLPYRNIDHSGIIHLSYSFARPILATNVGDFSEIIEERITGFLVEKDDHNILAEAIYDAFLNKNLLVEMGLKAQDLNTTKYSWDEIGKRTAELYSRLI
ncbi:MAG: glycosyltransferase family 4 protein [Ignavibacterium sp.]|nr:glycosyltransferase family 4 protein [Ignavibacterium sp.]